MSLPGTPIAIPFVRMVAAQQTNNKSSRSSRKATLLFAGLVLLAGLGGLLWLVRQGPAVATNGQVKGVLHLETFVVNLEDSGQRSYLRVGIDLGLGREIDKNQTELWNHMDDHEKRLAHIEGEHRVFTTTRGRRINDLGHIKTFDKE